MCHMSHQIALDEDTETSPPPVLLSGASVDKRVGETQNNSFFFFFTEWDSLSASQMSGRQSQCFMPVMRYTKFALVIQHSIKDLHM